MIKCVINYYICAGILYRLVNSNLTIYQVNNGYSYAYLKLILLIKNEPRQRQKKKKNELNKYLVQLVIKINNNEPLLLLVIDIGS